MDVGQREIELRSGRIVLYTRADDRHGRWQTRFRLGTERTLVRRSTKTTDLAEAKRTADLVMFDLAGTGQRRLSLSLLVEGDTAGAFHRLLGLAGLTGGLLSRLVSAAIDRFYKANLLKGCTLIVELGCVLQEEDRPLDRAKPVLYRSEMLRQTAYSITRGLSKKRRCLRCSPIPTSGRNRLAWRR
jgi:hypothetical protein